MAIITTYKVFTDALAALTVTGVTRKFTEPPASVGTADLPAMYPGLPRGNEGAMTFDGGGGWPALTCELIVLVEPVGQSTQPANYAATITVIDNLSTALRGATIGRAKLSWDINANVQVQTSDATYWAVVATITGY